MSDLTGRIALRLARGGQHSVFHAVVLALILTAVFMLRTASAWGAMGAIVVAISCYVVIAAILAEFVLLGFAVIRKIACRVQGSVNPAGPLDR